MINKSIELNAIRLNSDLDVYIKEYTNNLELTNNKIKQLFIDLLNNINLIPDNIEIYVDLAEIEIICTNRSKLNEIIEYLTTYINLESTRDGHNKPNSVKLSLPYY